MYINSNSSKLCHLNLAIVAKHLDMFFLGNQSTLVLVSEKLDMAMKCDFCHNRPNQ